MKILNTDQVRQWDAYTITHEPIRSVDLMNRASQAFTQWFAGYYGDTGVPVYIFCGTGNNGGDGLAVARYLHYRFYDVKVFLFEYSGKQSPDFSAQFRMLPKAFVVTRARNLTDKDAKGPVAVHFTDPKDSLPAIPAHAILIDALFGSGLTRPLEAPWAGLTEKINALPNEKVAIDVPSGLFCDRHSEGPAVAAWRTFSFEAPKLAFFLPENYDRVGDWDFGSIGLHPAFSEKQDTPFYFFQKKDARALVKRRRRFDHKGNFGHALLIAGAYGKMGAAVLAAQAVLRAGAGLLTVHTPRCGFVVLQGAVPEAMYSPDDRARHWSSVPASLEAYKVVGVGCGIGQQPESGGALRALLEKWDKPMVLDADALNLLAANPDLWRLVPRNSILTPHPGEFVRLFGPSSDDFARLELLRRKAQEHGVFIVLKGAYSAIAAPDGRCWFNSSGNPGMATAGSGDVLTGILTGLLSRGYAPLDAMLLGVYLHGLTGDLAAQEMGMEAVISSDLVRFIGPAFKALDTLK